MKQSNRPFSLVTYIINDAIWFSLVHKYRFGIWCKNRFLLFWSNVRCILWHKTLDIKIWYSAKLTKWLFERMCWTPRCAIRMQPGMKGETIYPYLWVFRKSYFCREMHYCNLYNFIALLFHSRKSWFFITQYQRYSNKENTRQEILLLRVEFGTAMKMNIECCF